MEYQEQSLGGQIFNRIRNDILSGNYAPGEELKEATLGKQLGVSRTPVREALRQLDLEGLVEIAPNRGAKVIGISRKDVEDIYHMRARLEGLAARKAAENIKEEELAELEEEILSTIRDLKTDKLRPIRDALLQKGHQVEYTDLKVVFYKHFAIYKK